jgi:hypothetical protein
LLWRGEGAFFREGHVIGKEEDVDIAVAAVASESYTVKKFNRNRNYLTYKE